MVETQENYLERNLGEATPEAKGVDLSTAMDAINAVEAENKVYRWNEIGLKSSETISLVTDTKDMCVNCDIKSSRIKSKLMEMGIKDTQFYLYCNTTKEGKPMYDQYGDPEVFLVWNNNNGHSVLNKYLGLLHMEDYVGIPRHRNKENNSTTVVCKGSIHRDYETFKRGEKLEKMVGKNLSKFQLGRYHPSCIDTILSIDCISALKTKRIFDDLLNLPENFWKGYKMTADNCNRVLLAIELGTLDEGNKFDRIINVDGDVFEVEGKGRNKRYSSVEDFLKSL